MCASRFGMRYFSKEAILKDDSVALSATVSENNF
jgi:hypothetical protein